MDAKQAGSIFVVIIFFGSTAAFALNWVLPQEREEKLPNMLDKPLSSDQQTSLIDQDVAVMTFFYIPGCQYCEATEPHIRRLAQEMPTKVMVVELDTSKYKTLAFNYNIKYVPVILIRGKAQEAPVRLEGQQEYKEIKDNICAVFLEKPLECY